MEGVGFAGGFELAESYDDDGVDDLFEVGHSGASGEGAEEGGFEFGELDGFIDEAVHAGEATFFAVIGLGIGRHGNDVNAFGRGGLGLFLLSIPDLPGGFVAAHVGHAAIHEDDVVGFAREGFEDLDAIGYGVCLVTELLELFEGDLLVERGIFSDEDFDGLGGRAWGGLGGWLHGVDGSGVSFKRELLNDFREL